MKNSIGEGTANAGLLRRLNITIIAFLLIVSFFLGGLINTNSYAAINSNSSWYGTGNGSNTVTETGLYVIEVAGGGYVGGGHIIGVFRLNNGDVIKTVKYSGGARNSWNGLGTANSTTAGGDAMLVFVNNTPLIGAGGASGKNVTGQVGWNDEGESYISAWAASYKSVTGINNTAFSAGGGGYFSVPSGWWGEGVNQGGSGATYTGCTAAASGTAGSNYLDTSKAVQYIQTNDSTTAFFSIHKLDMGDLPTEIGLFASRSVSSMYTAPQDDNYTIHLQTLNGDSVSGNIRLSAGDTLQVLKNGYNGNALIVIKNWNDVVMVCSQTASSLSTIKPAWKTVWTSGANVSYVNGSYISDTQYTNSSSPSSLYFQITKKKATAEDSYEYTKVSAQYTQYAAESLDRIALILENDVPVITVPVGVNFSVICGYYDDMQSGSAGEITVTNATLGDDCVEVTGKITAAGAYKYTVNDKVFIVRAIEAPTNSNVSVILQ